MKQLIFCLLSLHLTSGALMAIEQPRYAVLPRDGDFELRRYEPYLVAEVEVSASFEEAASVAFRPMHANRARPRTPLKTAVELEQRSRQQITKPAPFLRPRGGHVA